ncbi:MAG TPA: extracellular solute-binding protein [Chloroflexota bacterium]|nr:extracellular solute-binding protein [Chloroflexota bacterium]
MDYLISRRSLVAALGALPCALALSACGGAATPAPTAAPAKEAATAPKAAEPAKAAGKTKVVFSALGDAKTELPVVRGLADAFNSKSERISVEVQPFPEGGYAKALAMLEAKDTPDIMRVEDDQAWFVGKSGHVAELTRYYEADFHKNADDFHSFFFHEMHVDGKQFVFNANHVPALLFYNVAHFDEAGIKAPTGYKDAWEFPTFMAAAQKLVKKKGDFVERYAVFLNNWDELLPYAAGVGFFNHDQTKCNLEQPAFLDALKTFAELNYKEKLHVPPGENELELFNSGQLSMMATVAHQAQILNPDVKWKWMPFPKFKKHPYSSGYARAFVISKYGPSKDPDKAWEFLKYWASPEGSLLITKQPWGVAPTRKADDGFLKDQRWADKNVGLWVEQLDFTFPRNMTPMRFGTVRNIYQNGPKLDDIRLGKRDPAAWIKEVVVEIDNEIKKTGWKHVPPPLADKAPHNRSVYVRWYYPGPERDDDPRK